MLTDTIVICPDAVWMAEKRIFFLVYHTAIFADYYLTSPVNSFHAALPYTIGDAEHLPPDAVDDVIPDRFYSKQEMQAYLWQIRENCRKLIHETPEEKFHARWITGEEADMHGLCPSIVRHYTLLEILFYNLRHVQHHVGQLNMLLRQKANTAAEWIAEAG